MAFSISPVGGSDKPVLDITYLTDPVSYTHTMQIQNQSTQDLYFKITTSDANWSISSPTNGELGMVASGSTGTFSIQLQRAKPTADTTETVSFTIEAYSDSGYTTQVDSATYELTITIADMRSWANTTLYDFDDGTAQGWTLDTDMTVSNDLSVTAGGYSVKYDKTGATGTLEEQMSISVTLPSNAQVGISGLMAAKIVGADAKVNYLKITVGGTEVLNIDLADLGYAGDGSWNWSQFGVDLTSYAGQSVTIAIVIGVDQGQSTSNEVSVWLDEIIIAGNG